MVQSRCRIRYERNLLAQDVSPKIADGKLTRRFALKRSDDPILTKHKARASEFPEFICKQPCNRSRIATDRGIQQLYLKLTQMLPDSLAIQNGGYASPSHTDKQRCTCRKTTPGP